MSMAKLLMVLFAVILMANISIPAYSEHLSPKKQLELRVSPDDIQCKENRVLVIRDNGNPACVKESTANKKNWSIITTEFESHRFDDSRDVSSGPVFSSASGTASGAVSGSISGASDDQSNDEAEFYLMYNGTVVTAPIHTVSDITVSDITVHATDLEGDAISITVTPDMLPESAISVIDYTNGTATISINSTGILPGSNVFWVNVSDADNYQREPYVIIIPE